MKKILILSYHFEPMNVIASQRALGYANHFKKFGFEPTIVTHQWDKKIEEQLCHPKDILEKTIFEDNEKYKVYKMPIANFRRGKILSYIEKTKLNKLGIIFSWLTGHLDTRGIILNCKLTERYFLKEHLKNHKYDVIMGIFSPHYHLSNCNWVYKKYKLPFVLDYRDLWNNRIIHQEYKPFWKERFQDSITNYWWEKWGRFALYNSITSEPWQKKLEAIGIINTVVITNGFEERDLKIDSQKINTEFSIVHTGSLYNHQDLNVFFYAVNDFILKFSPKNLKVFFIGSKRKTNVSSDDLNSFLDSDKITSQYKLNNSIFIFTERMPRNESLNFIKMASVLYMPTFPKSPGTYSGKIFEYISSGVPIIAAPKDNGTIDKLIYETKTGICTDSIDELVNFISYRYHEWESSKVNTFEPNWEGINKYSRENQTKLYAEFLNKKLM